MLAAYDAIQHIRQYHILTRRAFCGWLGHQARQRRKRQQTQRATTHRDLLRLQGKPLLFWLHWTRVERHAKVKITQNLLPWRIPEPHLHCAFKPVLRAEFLLCHHAVMPA